MKRTLKRILGAVLMFTMLVTVMMPVAMAAAPASESSYTRIWGTISKVDTKNNQVEVMTGGKNPQSIILNIGKNTYIVDNMSHKKLSISKLKEGETIYAWHSNIMTMSMPPMTGAHVIVANIPMDVGAGQLFEVETVEKVASGYRLLNQEKDLYITIPYGTRVRMFNSSRTQRLSAIRPGTELLIWYDAVATSFPAQATVTEAIAFPYAYDGYVVQKGEAIAVNGGKTLTANAVTDKEYGTLLPMQEVAKRLGFRVTWSSKSEVMKLSKGTTKAALFIDADKLVLNEETEISMPGVQVIDGKVYAPVDVLRFLGDYKVVQQ